jgi:putative (di)nucleoside polyphosphate hydrolase
VLRLDATDHPEFDHYRWVDFWYPVQNVIPFKRRVYKRALAHFEPLLPTAKKPIAPGATGPETG